jgi:hydroxypyruvate reductase
LSAVPELPAALDRRRMLLECLQAGLEAVDARRCVSAQLSAEPAAGEWYVVSIGKAAGSMLQGALDVLGDRVPGGIVVTMQGHWPQEVAGRGNVRVLEAAHPVPDERSLEAGEAVLDFVARLPKEAQVLFLISGGASSLVEALVPGVTLAELQQLNRRALASGLGIAEVNVRRRTVSRIKGGGLAAATGGRRSMALMVSDVPGNDPAVIGSGLLHAPDSGRTAEMQPVPYRIVADIHGACRAAGACATTHGLRARIARRRFTGSATLLGRRFAKALGAADDGTLLVWGGESTVRLPARPGRGGRNQHLALSAAIALAGRDDAALLAAGTDGIDGVTDDAGGLVDGDTCARGALEGLDPRECLNRADSGRFLDASGDLVCTGATLTNVGDLVLGIRAAPAT